MILKKLEILESHPCNEIDDGIRNATDDLKLKENEFTQKKIEGMMLRSRIPHLETNEKEISLYARFEKSLLRRTSSIR